MPQGRQRSAGFVAGSVVAITFGTVFVLVNSGGVHAPWPLAIRVIGLVVAALLVVGLVLVVRRGSAVTPAAASGFVGNIRALSTGAYRLRFRGDGEMRTSPEAYPSRADAERALWKLAHDGRAEYNHDLRYRGLVLLATFASLRWGEAIALRRCDVDLRVGTVRVRASFAERSTGEIVLGPPKSKAGLRVVGIPKAIRPVLQDHVSRFVGPAPAALVFPGAKGGPLRRGNFNKMAGWPHAVQAIGAEGLHFHDLRHTGNAFAASSGAGLRDLMARMGHDSERAAIIYQHAARGADEAMSEAIDAQVDLL
jgi:integrase